MAGLSACGDASDDVAAQSEDSTQGFNRHFLLVDEAMVDRDSLTAADIQALLETTPYNTRSVLADHVSDGDKASALIWKAARDNGINPIAILVRTQLEQSLVAKTTATKWRLDRALGCGCPDGQDCFTGYLGFGKQVRCMAEKMRSYLDDLQVGQVSAGGWQVGKAKTTLDGYSVTPKNATTAALYTYTPWVSSQQLHMQIWRKFAKHLDYAVPAPGGCPTLEGFPSGLRVQLLPSLAMEDDFIASGIPNPPSCFIHAGLLYDPATMAVHTTSAKVANNFRLYEFADVASDDEFLLDPALVDALQRMRTELGASITVDVAFRRPGWFAAHCMSADAPWCEPGNLFATGGAAVISSGAGATALVEAASVEGVPSCWATDDGHVAVAVAGPAQGCPR